MRMLHLFHCLLQGRGWLEAVLLPSAGLEMYGVQFDRPSLQDKAYLKTYMIFVYRSPSTTLALCMCMPQ